MPSAETKRKLRARFDTGRLRPIAHAALDWTIAVEVALQRPFDWRRAPLSPLPAGSVTAVIKTFERPSETRRLVKSIRRVQPDLPILIVDDSRLPKAVAGAEMLAMPFNSGISAGRNAALRRVSTPYFLLLDDDFVFTRHTRLAAALSVMGSNPQIDILGGRVVNLPDFSTNDYSDAPLFPRARPPVHPPGSTIGGLPVYSKVPNFFIGRTAPVRDVGWSDALKVLEHRDFFTRASGTLTTVYDHDLQVLHARNPFDRSMPERTENEHAAMVELHHRYYMHLEMSTPMDAAVDEVLRAAVGHGLEGGAAWPAAPMPAEVFDRVLEITSDARLLGALAEAVADGALPLLPEQLELLTEHHAGSQAHMLRLERMLLRMAELFDQSGIDFRVLKGVALARLVYSDPSWRTAADLDLLIPSGQLDAAVAVAIDELGGEQVLPELRPGFDREFGKESLVRVGEIELDLHRTFVAGPFGLTIDLDELFRDGEEISIGDRQLLVLGSELQFLHACYNVALGDYPVRLGSVRDLLLCRERLEVEVDQVVGIARRWRGTAVVQRAAQLTLDTVGPGAAGDFAALADLAVPRRETWLLRSYLTPARSYSRPLASVFVIPGIRARLRYARAILAPSSTYLRSRGWTGGAHFRRAFRWLSGHG